MTNNYIDILNKFNIKSKTIIEIISKSINEASELFNSINDQVDLCIIDATTQHELIEVLRENIKKVKSFYIKENKIFFNFIKEKLNYKLVWSNTKAQYSSVLIRNDIYYNNIKKILDEIEIHMLICNKDLLLAINNLNSLRMYEEFVDMQIFLHDDGSLTNTDYKILSNINNVEIINRKQADHEIFNFIKDYPNCLNYRLGNSPINLWHKIKIFDYIFFSKTKKVLGLDTDLLFTKCPENIIVNLINDVAFYFPDVTDSYCFNEPKNEIPTLEKVNTGLIYIYGEENYDITSIETALKNLVGKGVNYFPAWIEQSAFAHMFYNKNYKSLDENKYRIPFFQNVDIKQAECLHFVSYPETRKLYKKYFDYLSFSEISDIFYNKKFEINFNKNKIPLEIYIKKYNNCLIIEFLWNLEKTNQKYLDHIFKINNETFKFQSESTGFFIINFSENLIIEHTYDWYGEQNWEILDSIYIY